jgi:hypothetical protein
VRPAGALRSELTLSCFYAPSPVLRSEALGAALA